MNTSTTSPGFSVLIPVHNRPELVRLTVDSVLAQSFASYQVIVVDDGSTDHTGEVLRSYGSRIILLRQGNRGAEAARSHGASVASGEYLVLLDSDDLLYPNALATYDRIIRSLDSPPVIIGAMSYFTHGGAPLENPPGGGTVQLIRFPDFVSKDRGVGLSCSSIVIKRSVAEATGALRREATAFPFDGNDIMLRLGTCTPCVLVARPFTVAYRSHDTNVSKRLGYLLESASGLARCEQQGDYPGGKARRFERRAYVGGVCWSYALRGLKMGMFKESLRLLGQVFPMVANGAVNTLVRRLRKPAPVISLSD